MEKIFHLKENGTDVKTEIIAGITTFLAIAYILVVNPALLSDAGMPSAGVFMATAISAAFATAIMAFWANYPVALASGMGLNAYFAYTVCGNLAAQGIKDPWKIGLTAILFEGILFIILSFFKFRETLVNTIPSNLKYAITAGIGLFITIVGLNGAGVIVSDPATLVALGDLSQANVALALIGVLITGALLFYEVRGGILLGIIITWILGMGAQTIGWYKGISVFPDFANNNVFTGFSELGEIAFQFDFSYIFTNTTDFIVIIFAFLFVDLFDTVGTLIGVAAKGNLLDKDGKLPRVGRALMADAVGTVAGSCLGTSTVTSFVESSAGVAEGGRTGLTALTTAVMFILSIFLAPIFLAIPSFATTPALVIVGMLMMSSIAKVKFEGDIADVLSAFVAIFMMPFTYSIANGIMFGVLAWVILKVLRGRIRDIHPIIWIITVLFAVRISMMIMGLSA